jgi:kinesin family member 21
VGKLSGHNSTITTMLVDNNLFITGSKDHYVKVFEMAYDLNLDVDNKSSNALLTKYSLNPPHYDGVQALCSYGDSLFSASRDMCIKKWSLNDYQCKQVNRTISNEYFN